MTAPSLSPVTSTNRVVHLQDARMLRRERGELATEGLAAFTLIDAAQTAYRAHHMGPFLVLNTIAGAALAVVVIRGVINIKRNRGAGSRGTNLVGVFGGLTTVAEALHKLHTAQFTFGHKHFALGVFTLLVGIFTTVLALMAERLEHRRALTISDDGVSMRLNKFRRFDIAWNEIAELRIGERDVRLSRISGRGRVVPLGRLVNREQVKEALVAAARARGVKITGSVVTVA